MGVMFGFSVCDTRSGGAEELMYVVLEMHLSQSHYNFLGSLGILQKAKKSERFTKACFKARFPRT